MTTVKEAIALNDERELAIDEAKAALGIETMYEVHFECTECGDRWDMLWSCACDDECPYCGTVMTPYDYDEVLDDD